ncbi:MAG: discoidin domain-containing protein [Clostridia bacterium]|nr:discoidin domain-containing protein [Clostridia bacterium]
MLKEFFKNCVTALTAVSVMISPFTVLAAGTDVSGETKTRLVTYQMPETGVDRSGTYTVKARPAGTGDDAWQELDVYKVQVMSNGTRQAAMVYFDCDGPVDVQVTCIGGQDGLDNIENGLNDETKVYPESYGISLDYTKGDNVITLTARPNQTIVLDPNGDTRRNLQIWANEIMTIPTEDEVKAQGKSVTVYDASAEENNTIKSCDTDVVYVKPGYYNDSFNVKSNQTWYLEGGAVIHGTIDMDFTTNAKLIGRGLIYRPDYASMTVNDTVNTYIDGIMGLNHGWKDNGGYFINIANSKNVVVKNLRSIARHKWGDSMDIFCSEDITVEGCFFRGNDDCIAIYGPRWTGNYWGDTGNVRNIKVKKCVLMPDLARPIHFGTHGDSSSPNGGRVIDNCRFEDIDILTYNKYAFKNNSDGTINRMPQPIRMDVSEGNSVTNIYFNNIRIRDFMANELVELFITTQDRYGTYTYPGKAINNIYFKDIDYKNEDDTFTSRIEGYKTSDGKDGITQNITFENVKINGSIAKSAEDIHAKVGSNAKNIRFANSGETRYIYNPSIVPEDIWPEYYDYARIDGASANAEISENGSSPLAALDNDDSTVWYSPVSEQDPIYNDNDKTLTGNGITVDLGEQRHIKNVRITWANPSLTHDYRIYVSKDAADWSAGHSDEHAEGAVNPRTRAERNKLVKSNWLANQHDPVMSQDNVIGRYVKIIPQRGSQLDISKLEILGEEKPQ